jgi:hypothetical protein
MRIAEFRLRIVIIKNHSIRANPTNIPHPPAPRLRRSRGFELLGKAHRALRTNTALPAAGPEPNMVQGIQ